MGEDLPGFEPLLLLLVAGFRAFIDRLHAELGRQGHPDVCPVYGFAMQAIGLDGASASELGRRPGVSKQAAGKTVGRLQELGYAERVDDPVDGRRKLIRLPPAASIRSPDPRSSSTSCAPSGRPPSAPTAWPIWKMRCAQRSGPPS